MEYCIKAEGWTITEVLKVDEYRPFVRVWRYERGRLTTQDDNFSDQLELEGITDDKFLDAVDSLLDSLFASDFLDIAELYDGY